MQIERFLERHADFVVKPVPGLWAELCPGVAPPGAQDGSSAPGEGLFMALSPARHGTDGFFAAVLERRP
jgi:16S rRNA (cytosine967-C5)-methyltransferase